MIRWATEVKRQALIRGGKAEKREDQICGGPEQCGNDGLRNSEDQQTSAQKGSGIERSGSDGLRHSTEAMSLAAAKQGSECTATDLHIVDSRGHGMARKDKDKQSRGTAKEREARTRKVKA